MPAAEAELGPVGAVVANAAIVDQIARAERLSAEELAHARSTST